MQRCEAYNIIVFCLPSHLLQPLDGGRVAEWYWMGRQFRTAAVGSSPALPAVWMAMQLSCCMESDWVVLSWLASFPAKLARNVYQLQFRARYILLSRLHSEVAVSSVNTHAQPLPTTEWHKTENPKLALIPGGGRDNSSQVVIILRVTYRDEELLLLPNPLMSVSSVLCNNTIAKLSKTFFSPPLMTSIGKCSFLYIRGLGESLYY